MNVLLGLEPDVMQSNRTPNPQMPFLSSAARAENDLKFTLNVSPGRIDIFVQPATDLNKQIIPVINAKKALDAVTKRLERKGALDLKNVYRFAVVCAFLDQMANLDTVNKAFFDKVGLPYMAGATDQSLSLNVRKNIGGIKPEVNRLVRFSVDMLQQLEMIAGGPGPIDLNNGRVINEALFLRSSIDVNSVPMSAEFIDPAQMLAMAKAFSGEVISLYEMKSVGEMV